jgi:hypothetical protein
MVASQWSSRPKRDDRGQRLCGRRLCRPCVPPVACGNTPFRDSGAKPSAGPLREVGRGSGAVARGSAWRVHLPISVSVSPTLGLKPGSRSYSDRLAPNIDAPWNRNIGRTGAGLGGTFGGTFCAEICFHMRLCSLIVPPRLQALIGKDKRFKGFESSGA